ncbi:MAG: HAD family phosphatase [Lachnospiraceae bacterium]|nr:HAD family phosphatase [Lachnospiraceae bacterium]
MKDFDAVVFDMDGVIFDSERAARACWKELADPYGLKDIDAVYETCIGSNKARTKGILFAAYGADFPYEDFDRDVSALYQERYSGGRLPMKSGVVPLLSFLKQAGIKIALASSTRRQRVLPQLCEAGILDYFDAVVTGDMVQKSKPEPDIFLLACEKIGTAPERCYAIEDSHNGIRAAARGGLRPIMVPDLLPADEEMRSLSETVKDTLEDVKKYLETD